VEKESEVVFKDVTLDCDTKAERQIQDALFENVERFLGSKFIAGLRCSGKSSHQRRLKGAVHGMSIYSESSFILMCA